MKIKITTENIVRAIIVSVLVLYASFKYEMKNVIFGLLIIFGMTLFGASLVRLYQELMNYWRSGMWNLALVKSVTLACLVIVLPVIFIFILSPTIKIYVFVILGVVLSVLLIFDIVKEIIKKM